MEGSVWTVPTGFGMHFLVEVVREVSNGDLYINRGGDP